ncbi:MAG: NAD-dependent epimerase/dehydratase family protein [Thermoguttaceae bacterium]|jgi:nucleoside-diphosphate-sugar epimerase
MTINKDERIFVTGASGFIGTSLVRQLLAAGHKVRGMSRKKPAFPPGYGAPPDELWDHPNFEYFQGDITDLSSLRRGIEGCGYVVHLAGYAKNFSRDPSVFHKVNVEGMRNVFTAAKEKNIKKIVWTSSIVTFGPTPKGVVADETFSRTTHKYLTEYEESKSIAEKEALRWVAEGLPLVIVNPTRVYGPGQLSEGNALSRLIDDYACGRFPFLVNLGVNVGNYVLVDDVARGHLLALTNGRVGERYILGAENASLKEFFKTIEEVTGKKHFKIPLLTFWPMVVGYTLLGCAKLFGIYPRITPGWVRTFIVDWAYSCEKARRELGYEPTGLKEGLAQTCQWLRAQRKSRKG